MSLWFCEKKGGEQVFALFKAFTIGIDLYVTLGDFTVQNAERKSA